MKITIKEYEAGQSSFTALPAETWFKWVNSSEPGLGYKLGYKDYLYFLSDQIYYYKNAEAILSQATVVVDVDVDLTWRLKDG